MSFPSRRTLRIFAFILLGYGLLAAPGFFSPGYLDSPAGLLVAAPFLSVYLLHALGLPGLLDNNGLCGWGWCAPSLLGWTVMVLLWLSLAFGLAALISGMMVKPDR